MARGRWIAVALAFATASSCKEAPREEARRSGEPTAAQAAALQRAGAAAMELARSLRQRLVAAMAQGGAVGAVEVCAREARDIAAAVAARSGVRVGRASLRLRNPANAAPAWVGTWLAAQGEGPAARATSLSRIEAGPAGPLARVIKPIAVEGLCVTCHGPRESIDPRVAEALRRSYPQDRAVGYRPGDLRGALWAEVDAPP
jgi:hypothetical protein